MKVGDDNDIVVRLRRQTDGSLWYDAAQEIERLCVKVASLDSVIDSLQRHSTRLEEERDYNAGLVVQRDEIIKALKVSREAWKRVCDRHDDATLDCMLLTDGEETEAADARLRELKVIE